MEADARRLFLNDAGRNGHDGILGRMLLIRRAAAGPLVPTRLHWTGRSFA